MPEMETPLKVIIVDDEPYCCEVLAAMLEADCPGIDVVGIFNSGEDALQAIQRHAPDIVFLDVEMPRMNGFDMLERIGAIHFHLIFTTSYDQYALKAIRFSAIDYLLKPVDREELKLAVQKVKNRMQALLPQQLETLLQKMRQPAHPVNKIALPTMDGLELIPVNLIVSCESDDNYTKIRLKGNRNLTVTRSLKEMEEMLDHYAFTRVHRFFLVNLNEVEKYIKGEGGYLLMSDGTTIDVARNRKDALLKKLLPHKG